MVGCSFDVKPVDDEVTGVKAIIEITDGKFNGETIAIMGASIDYGDGDDSGGLKISYSTLYKGSDVDEFDLVVNDILKKVVSIKMGSVDD